MSKYKFYYDESEHSRKINYNTTTAKNYYDNFITAIIGFSNDREIDIYKKYADFEEKYQHRSSNGEIKSQTLKQNQFDNGFASLNKDNVQFIDDFLSIIDNDFVIYFAVISKLEFIINQIFEDYHCDMDYIKYTIVKSIMIYQPPKIINVLFEKTNEFVSALKEFYKERIKCDEENYELKQREIYAYRDVLLVLEDIKEIKTIEWNYDIAFWGFEQYLKELSIVDYDLFLDKEGNGNTLKAAKRTGLINVIEKDSKDVIGIRIADMMAGLISKLLKAIHNALSYKTSEESFGKKLLGENWFKLSQEQLKIYKKLCALLCKKKDWYKFFAGNYADELVEIISLLQYMDQFNTISDIEKIEMQGEYYNSYCCDNIKLHYARMENKLPIEFGQSKNGEYFLNRKGAKVYYDVTRQPLLKITKGTFKCKVLSVGITNSIPLVTIETNSKGIECYRLPIEYYNWALTAVGFANRGENLFPSDVVFTKENGRYYVDIL